VRDEGIRTDIETAEIICDDAALGVYTVDVGVSGIDYICDDPVGRRGRRDEYLLDHRMLGNRSAPNQHPISAITDLENRLTAADNVIETIRLGGEALPVHGKAVNIPMREGADGIALRDGKLYLTVGGMLLGDGVELPSGGGSSTPDNNAVFTLTNATGWLSKTIPSGAACPITVAWSSVEDGIPTGSGTLTVTVNGAVKTVRTVAQGTVSIDAAPYLTAADNTVAIALRDRYGNSRTIIFSVAVMSLSLSSTFSGSAVYSGDIGYFYTPVGAAEKTVHFILDGVELPTASVTVSGRQQTMTIPAQPHGAHTFEVYFTAEVDGETVESNRLYYDLICAEEGNNTPIISLPFKMEEAAQYDNLVIPYTVYVPDALTAAVTLSANGKEVASLTVDRAQQQWIFRPDQSGELILSVACGSTVREITLNVTPTVIDVEAETDSLLLHLDSYGRSNSEGAADRASWKFTPAGGEEVTAVFSGFNWSSDGWQPDEGNTSVLRVAGDARLYIPFAPFAADCRTSGLTVELEFATRDVVDYETDIITCVDGGRGLVVTPQKATLRSEQTELFTQYKEGEHIRLAFVIEKSAEHRLVYVYINGIMSGVARYPVSDDFSQAVPQGISIGSGDCTVDLYSVRVYGNSLTRHQVLDNWIADTRSITEKLARYRRNNVFNAYGDIVISMLPAELPYLVFEAAELPTYKGDKRTVEGYYTDPQHPEQSFEFEEAQADVQGTSSQYYARKNFKVKFKGGFVRDGMTYSTYRMREDSIGVDTFTFKADVASSEGANNVELVRLYDEISPYRTPPQQADERVRQGIDGFPIVVFQDDGTGVRFIGKYNFNNDKGTPEVFGFAEGDESWEILNNDSARVMFKSGDFAGWQSDFEARYPEDSEEIENFRRFVAWVASTDRSAATDAPLDSPAEIGGTVYTADTAAYRLAKFKAGIGDWVELDSALFYYLFTEFFLMIDSRAKNMFPSRLGGSKWCFLPYDFDTALGINNVGKLTFGYNLEDIDTHSGGTNVFNGQPSVLWSNLREAFFDELAAMYRTLRSTGGLTYDRIISAFAEHQGMWPEAVWNEDAYFKYLQPLVDDGDASYLDMLLGSKAEQRKWWLYNRFRYIDSKYTAGDSAAQCIVLRMYHPADITVTPYADIYAAVKYGSQQVRQRAQRGQQITLPCPFSDVGANGTETMIYSAPQLSDVGDLSPLKVGFANFSAATRLQSLKLGDASPDYSNGNLTTLQLGNNTLLRTLDVRGCPNLTGAVDISGCTGIEHIYFEGTSISGLELPVGGSIRTLHLPETTAALTIRNHPTLTDFVLPSAGNITSLWLENSGAAVGSLEMLYSIAATARVRLPDVAWVLDTKEDAVTLTARVEGMRGIDLDGQSLPKAVISGEGYVTDTIDVDTLCDMDEAMPNVAWAMDGLEGAVMAADGGLADSTGALLVRDEGNVSRYSAEVINEFLVQSLRFLLEVE